MYVKPNKYVHIFLKSLNKAKIQDDLWATRLLTQGLSEAQHFWIHSGPTKMYSRGGGDVREKNKAQGAEW